MKNPPYSLAAWEIASLCVSYLLALWLVVPLSGGAAWVRIVPLGLAGALVLLSHRTRGETWHAIGWRWDNFTTAARLLVLPTLSAMALFLGLGWQLGTLNFSRSNFATWVLWLPVWALVQQYILQGYVHRRAQLIWGTGWRSIGLTALVFALLHAPNPLLCAATLIGGVLWAWVYQKAPNLPALALSHALASLSLACGLSPYLKSLRVGINYFG